MAKLYHGSDCAVERPDVSRNTGFADLGRGFYLTDDHIAAAGRARSRARVVGVPAGIVSAYEFDEGAIPWVTWGADGPIMQDGSTWTSGLPFALQFAHGEAGFAAWMRYIRMCRRGECDVPGFGEPAAVCAWIATDEVEMACSGFVPPEELAPFVDPDELVVQYCLRDQALVDRALRFTGALPAT
ncbi:MAG: DUF3990 domain-containing protein [Eggerthellaceae bacterium]|nr:DUF3990 domain-containing protein [Eggerthellaceae bacterium]